MPQEDAGQPGRPVDPESQRSRLERGEARQLRVVVSEDIYRTLKVLSAKTDRTLSQMTEEALIEWLSRHQM